MLTIDFTTLFDEPSAMPETSLDVALREYDAWYSLLRFQLLEF
jgi:hypothetical protein